MERVATPDPFQDLGVAIREGIRDIPMAEDTAMIDAAAILQEGNGPMSVGVPVGGVPVGEAKEVIILSIYGSKVILPVFFNEGSGPNRKLSQKLEHGLKYKSWTLAEKIGHVCEGLEANSGIRDFVNWFCRQRTVYRVDAFLYVCMNSGYESSLNPTGAYSYAQWKLEPFFNNMTFKTGIGLRIGSRTFLYTPLKRFNERLRDNSDFWSRDLEARRVRAREAVASSGVRNYDSIPEVLRHLLENSISGNHVELKEAIEDIKAEYTYSSFRHAAAYDYENSYESDSDSSEST